MIVATLKNGDLVVDDISIITLTRRMLIDGTVLNPGDQVGVSVAQMDRIAGRMDAGTTSLCMFVRPNASVELAPREGASA